MEFIWNKLKTYSDLVMFEHTFFNLPFGYLALFLAANGWPSLYHFFWVTVAMVGARNGANAWNRYIDQEIDARNPRTADRHLPQGGVTQHEVLGLTFFCFALLLLGGVMLDPICVKLLPLAIVIVTFYSYTKRYTWACHLILGIAVALAPLGAWLAVKGSLSYGIIVLALVQTLWVAGFDIIYGTQDYYFDKSNKLYSIPVRFGVQKALKIAGAFHLMTILLLISLHHFFPLGIIYDLGIVVIALLLIYEHRLVTPDDLSQVKLASYSINQIIGPLLLMVAAIDIII